jgi:molybdenum cofactor cytidylyltransferase
VNVAAIVLAAGASRRLGRPKQTVVLAGETLVERAVRVAREAGFDSIFVVIADAALAGPLEAMGATALLNQGAAEGIASSIRVGVEAARALSVVGVVVMTCDQIAVPADHLRVLCAQPESAAGSAYGGAIGIPAYLPRASFEELLSLRGDQGARSLLGNARSVVAEELNLDVDTEEDFERARELLEVKKVTGTESS